MKTLILSCLAAVALISMAGCCDNDRERHQETYQSASYDSKDMHSRHHHNTDQQ